MADLPSQPNPSNRPQEHKAPVERKRISMSTPQLKLEVPSIPGFHLHWFLGRNVPRALRGGYEFVDPSEVDLNQTGLANDAMKPGGTDLGGRLTVPAGTFEGKPEDLFLMKTREEWWKEDQKILEKRNDDIMASLLKPPVGPQGENTSDGKSRYLKTSIFTSSSKK